MGNACFRAPFWYFMASLGLADVYLSGAGSPGKGAIDGQMKKGELWLAGIRQQTGTRMLQPQLTLVRYPGLAELGQEGD